MVRNLSETSAGATHKKSAIPVARANEASTKSRLPDLRDLAKRIAPNIRLSIRRETAPARDPDTRTEAKHSVMAKANIQRHGRLFVCHNTNAAPIGISISIKPA